jgi:hypothetical protein
MIGRSHCQKKHDGRDPDLHAGAIRNASKHKAMSYERMKKREAELKAEVAGMLRRPLAQRLLIRGASRHRRLPFLG